MVLLLDSNFPRRGYVNEGLLGGSKGIMYPFHRWKSSQSSLNSSEPMNSRKLSGIYQEEVPGPQGSPLLQLNEYSLFVLVQHPHGTALL